MTTIESIKSSINDTIDHAQMKVDALKVQASLGKAELEDNLKVKTKEAQEAAEKLVNYLESVGASVGESVGDTIDESKKVIERGADTLKVKFALGKMDCESAVEKAKDDITKYSSQFDMELTKVKEVSANVEDKVKDELSNYMTKMSNLKATIEAKAESFKK